MFGSLIKKNDSGARLALAATALLFLTGCGSSLQPREGAFSANSASFGAECNHFTSSSGLSLAGRVTANYANGALQEDRVRLSITSLASEFSQSSTMSVRFFRWTVDANGTVNLDQQPLSFTVENPSSMLGPVQISGTMTALTLADINNLSWSGGIFASSVQDFLNKVVINVVGTDYSWSALKVALYNGNEAVSQADLLLPVFAANPNAYAQTHHGILNALHPFWAQRSEVGVSDAEWVNRSKSYCF